MRIRKARTIADKPDLDTKKVTETPSTSEKFVCEAAEGAPFVVENDDDDASPLERGFEMVASGGDTPNDLVCGSANS